MIWGHIPQGNATPVSGRFPPLAQAVGSPHVNKHTVRPHPPTLPSVNHQNPRGAGEVSCSAGQLPIANQDCVSGTSPGVQWLRFCAPNACGLGFDPWSGN